METKKVTNTSKATASKTTAAKTTTKKAKINDDDIRRRAEEIYAQRVARGESGDHVTDWLAAEKELKKSKS